MTVFQVSKNLAPVCFQPHVLMYVWYECIWTPEFPETLCAALWLCSFWGLRKPLYWSRHPATFKHSKSLIKRLSFACKTSYPDQTKKIYTFHDFCSRDCFPQSQSWLLQHQDPVCVSKNQHFHVDLYSVESIKNAWVQVDTSSVLM